jgi:hypothetical protein
MSHDFNDAGEQRTFDLIPADTVATLHLTVRPGQAGEGGWLRRSKAGDSEALDCEFTVVDGPYAKRKFWSLFTLEGVTEGHAQAADISRRRLRAVLESARGIRPNDKGESAKNARQITSYGEFDGIRFIGKVGIEPAKGEFKPKNILLEAITPDRKEWHQPDNSPAPQLGLAPHQPTAATIVRPQWAK